MLRCAPHRDFLVSKFASQISCAKYGLLGFTITMSNWSDAATIYDRFFGLNSDQESMYVRLKNIMFFQHLFKIHLNLVKRNIKKSFINSDNNKILKKIAQTNLSRLEQNILFLESFSASGFHSAVDRQERWSPSCRLSGMASYSGPSWNCFFLSSDYRNR